VCEEAAALPERQMVETVMPLMVMEKTALVCISSIQDPENHFSRMLLKKTGDPPRPFYKVMSMQLVCDKPACKVDPLRCTHKLGDAPPWQTAGRQMRVREMMSDSPEVCSREMAGVMTDGPERLFPRELVEQQILRAPTCATGFHMPAPPYVYICVDPNANGERSHYALVAFFRNTVNGRMVICALGDHDTSRNRDARRTIIVRYMRALRAHPRLRTSRFVVAIENNLGTEADTAQLFVQWYNKSCADEHERVGNYTFLRDQFVHGVWQVGMHMTDTTKAVMAEALGTALIDKAPQFEWWTDPLAFDTDAQASSAAVLEANKALLVTQLAAFKRVYYTVAGGRQRVEISGKEGGRPDDLAVAFQWGFIVERQFLAEATGRYALPDRNH